MRLPDGTDDAIEALLLSVANADKTRLQGLPADELNALVSHRRALEEVLSIAEVFFKGFEEISKNGPLAAKVSSPTKTWVAGVPRRQSGTRMAGMAAASLCAVLEGYVALAAPRSLTPARITALRLHMQLPSNDEKARAKLLRAVKPSVKAQGDTWAGSLTDVFGIVLAPEERAALVNMIAFRNLYVHDPRKAFLAQIDGANVKAWSAATILLCHRLALA